MRDYDIVEDEVVDLGKASVETKGNAVIGSDPSGGRQSFLSGILDD